MKDNISLLFISLFGSIPGFTGFFQGHWQSFGIRGKIGICVDLFKNSNCVLQTIVIRLLDVVKSEFVNNACCIWEPVARGGDEIIWNISDRFNLDLTLMERGFWMLLERGGGLNQPAPSRSPQNTVKNQKFFF